MMIETKRRTNSAPSADPSQNARALYDFSPAGSRGGRRRGGYVPPTAAPPTAGSSYAGSERGVAFRDSMYTSSHAGGGDLYYERFGAYPSDRSVSPSASLDHQSITFMAPTSRGKEFAVLDPAVNLRQAKTSKCCTAAIIVAAIIAVGGLVAICALLSAHHGSTPAPGAGKVLGIGGYTLRARSMVCCAVGVFPGTCLPPYSLALLVLW